MRGDEALACCKHCRQTACTAYGIAVEVVLNLLLDVLPAVLTSLRQELVANMEIAHFSVNTECLLQGSRGHSLACAWAMLFFRLLRGAVWVTTSDTLLMAS